VLWALAQPAAAVGLVGAFLLVLVAGPVARELRSFGDVAGLP